MSKRIIAVFSAFCIAVGCIYLRLYDIACNPTKYVSSTNSHYDIFELQNIRGKILDCNGNNLVDTQYDNFAVAKPTINALKSLEKVLDSNAFIDIKSRMQKSNSIYINLKEKIIETNSDILNVKVFKRNSSAQLTQHLLGYVDGDFNGVNGIEYSFNDILTTGKFLTARILKDAQGRTINGSPIEIINDNIATSSVQLTIDGDIQRIVENALDLYKIEQGGAVVVDVKSGAIKASASRPNYNSNELQKALSGENSPLLNRVLQSYSVGSVFKVAVCIGAMNCGIYDFEYYCNGSCEVDGIKFNCNKSTAHGSLNMQKALQYSCNCYFINLAKKIGASNLLETANALGFGQSNGLTDTIISKGGILPTLNELSISGELANFSFGQGKFTASMLQVAQMMMCVANGGKYVNPYLIERVTSAENKVILSREQSYPTVVMQKSNANKLKMMLQSVVESGNAIKAKPSLTTAAGKTATAQTGTFDKSGVEICNTWFAGFFPVDEPKYVVVILKQGGSSGANDNAPAFKMIADKISYIFS